MNSEKIMKLFDTCWFEMEILKKQSRSSCSSIFEATPVHQNEEEEPSKPEILRIPSSHRRSMSAQLCSDTVFDSFSLSPDSVLSPSKLQTILSGKEITDEVEETNKQAQAEADHVEEYVSKNKVVGTSSRRRKKKNSESKSLSDLEFEELKGFMDLGFVFTEEDNKDSRLVEIVPGLQRLSGRKKDDTIESPAVPRPYLSEAWEIMEDSKRKENSVLMDWKIPALNNEMDMKDNLRWWAHAVASSAVR